MKTKTFILIIILAAVGLTMGLYIRQHYLSKPVSAKQGQHDTWYCPMHPWIKSDKSGVCPICGMTLVPSHAHHQEASTGILGLVPVEISQEKQQLAAIRTALVDKKDLIKTIRAAGQYKGEIFAQVFEVDLPLIKIGQKAIVEVPAFHQKYDGAVNSIDSSIDESSRTISVRIWLEQNHQKKFKTNMFVNVELPVDLGEAIFVPRQAVMDTGIRKIVFVEKNEGTFEPRVIQTGVETDDAFEVTTGLKEGERIVVSGNFLLDSEARVQADLEEGGNNGS